MRTIAIGLSVGLALVIGVIVANWTGLEPAVPGPGVAAPQRAPVPSQIAIDACNRQAAAQPSRTGTTVAAVKDRAIGAGDGALYGIDEARKNDERYRDAYASCMRSRRDPS